MMEECALLLVPLQSQSFRSNIGGYFGKIWHSSTRMKHAEKNGCHALYLHSKKEDLNEESLYAFSMKHE
jgi:hypothetical protein